MRVCFPLRSFEWTTVAEEWRKNGSGVFRLQCSSKRRFQRCLTVLNQRSLHRLIVKLQLPFFIHHRYIFKFASLFYFFFLIFLQRGKGKGRRGSSSTAESRNTGILYTLVSPFPYTRRDTSHSRLNTSSFRSVCFCFPRPRRVALGRQMEKKFTIVLYLLVVGTYWFVYI